MIEGANGEASLSDGRVKANRAFLVCESIEYSVLIPTVVSLEKSIFDATCFAQDNFKLLGFHDYGNQRQGLFTDKAILSKKLALKSYTSIRGV